MTIDVKKFEEDGILGPLRLFDRARAEALLRERFFPKRLLTWYKSYHQRSIPVVRAASDPGILDVLRPVLGNDILLWGSVFIGQTPEQAHAMHLDVEHSRWDGVTLWLGLKNLTEETTVSVITRSHRLATSPQQLKTELGVDPLDNAQVLEAARKLDPKCELATFRLAAGEFIVWNGRTWHATSNKSRNIRFSLIMQYCSPNNRTRIPTNYELPNTTWSDTKPPCVLVSGQDRFRINDVVTKQQVESSGKYLRPLFAVAFRGCSAITNLRDS